MKIIHVHHALREKGNPPTQEDGIQPLGIKDAETTAELLKGMSERSKSTFRAIYTSPYYRCAKTAEIINKYMNLPIYEEPRFNEFKNVFEVIENGKNVTKTETWLQCQTRIREAIKDIVEKDELKEALKNKEISKAEYNKANKVTKQLFKELQDGTNQYKNIDFTKYLK